MEDSLTPVAVCMPCISFCQVFLPAIGQTVAAHEGFRLEDVVFAEGFPPRAFLVCRLFAAQNPVATGGHDLRL